MTDYYVMPTGINSNSGLSMGDAWRDINFAVNNPIVNAGDRILVGAGTYNERVFVVTNSGALGNEIQLVALPGGVVIDGQYNLPAGAPAGGSGQTCPVSNTANNPVPGGGTTFTAHDFVYSGLVHFRQVSHWTVTGIKVVNSRGRGFVSEQTTNITWRSVELDGARQAMWWTNGVDTTLEDSDLRDGGNFFPHVRASSCVDWPVGVNTIGAVNTIIQRNCIYEHWGEGVGTGRDSRQITIQHNIVYDNAFMDIYDHFGEDVLIDGNFVYRTTSNKYNRGTNPPTSIVRNMEQGNFPNSVPANRHRLTNNLVVGLNSFSLAVWNNQGGGSPVGDWVAANNTFINVDTGLGRGYPIQSITNGNNDTNAVFHNNTLIRLNGGSVFTGTNITSSAWDFSHNASSSPLPGFMQSGNDKSVQASDLVGPLTNPPPGTKWDPSVGEQKPTSPTIDCGLATFAPADDYAGTARPQGAAVDIGYHEFSDVVQTCSVDIIGHQVDGLTVTLELQADCPGIATFTISLGDGSIITTQSTTVTHDYAGAGDYDITVDMVCVTDAQSAFELLLTDFKCNEEFAVEDLPTTALQQLHTDWWAMYNAQNTDEGTTYTRYGNLFSDPMEQMLELPLDPPDRNGSYSIARAWSLGMYSIVETLRMTGDPAVLDEICWWSQQVRTHVGDWDGRGYEYIRFEHPSNEDQDHVDSDTNWLDESMLGGILALMAYVMHQNADKNPACAAESDYWLTYLDELHVPKWLYRTHWEEVGNRPAYTPPAALGLQNAIGWTGTHANGADDATWTNPGQNQWGNHPMRHPVRQFAHAAIMSMGMHYILGKCFTELGRTPKGNWDLTAAEYTQQALDIDAWFLDQSTLEADGGRTTWLRMNGPSSPAGAHQSDGTVGLNTGPYMPHANYWAHFFHYENFGHFADPARMQEYAIALVGGDDDIYTPGNYNNMANRTDGSGTFNYRLRTSALLAPWDTTGYLEQAAGDVTNSPTNHAIQGGPGVDGTHYNGLMLMELV